MSPAFASNAEGARAAATAVASERRRTLPGNRDILTKTWAKMSPAGHGAAIELAGSLPERLQGLVARAVGVR